MTVPTGLSVSGSPITTSGTFGVTLTTNYFIPLNNVDLNSSSQVVATHLASALPVAQGGTGAATLTGPLKGNGTSAFTAAAAADLYGLFTGTHTSSYCMAGDGTMQAIGGGYTLPTASTTVLGGVKVDGTSITISSGVISAPGAGGGTITAVTGTAPVVSSGGTAPAISMAAATDSVPGYMTSADHTALTANTAKVTNATHTGDATGATALTVVAVQSYGMASGAPTTGDFWRFNGTSWLHTPLVAGDIPDISATYLAVSSFTAAGVTGKLLTGFSSGAGTVAGTDTILQAINKLDGNIAAKAPSINPAINVDSSLGTSTGAGLYIPGSSLTAGNIYYQASGGLTAAKADVATTLPGICIATSTTTCTFSGVYRFSSSQSWTAGNQIYISDSSAGALVTTAPSTTGHFVQKVGIALANDTILIMPSINILGL
jgi:hypothetical protein